MACVSLLGDANGPSVVVVSRISKPLSTPDIDVSAIIPSIFSSIGLNVAFNGKHPLPSFSALSYSMLVFPALAT